MPRNLDDQIHQLKQTIAEIEAQRPVLGDAVIEVSLKPFRETWNERARPTSGRWTGSLRWVRRGISKCWKERLADL